MKKRDFKIGFIGLGNMGRAIIEGTLNIFPASLISGYDISGDRSSYAHSSYRITVKKDVKGVLDFSDVVFLCVKPQDMKSILQDIKNNLPERRIIFVSIAAGVKISLIERYVCKNPIIRVMPNLAAFIGESLNAYTCSKRCLIKEEIKVLTILSSFGTAVKFDSESDLDKVTAVSGSGPAYIFYFFDALKEGARKIGLDEKSTLLLLKQTFASSLRLLEEGNFDAKGLIKKVASKKGTTEQALKVFARHKFKNVVSKAVTKAFLRARKLSKEASK